MVLGICFVPIASMPSKVSRIFSDFFSADFKGVSWLSNGVGLYIQSSESGDRSAFG